MHNYSRVIILLTCLLLPVTSHAATSSGLLMKDAVIAKVKKESGMYYLQIEEELYRVTPDARIEFCKQKKPIEYLYQLEGDQVTLHINKDKLIDKVLFLCM